uniref:non-specific serine/threonine protein kinase n=1 Tax=Strigamia maritima TaxID=126957 RepID=T1J2M8_STRMM
MDSLGDYEYNAKDLIGHGAFAVVYKGRKKRTPNYVVAIKCIAKKNLPKSQNLLEKEIKILKELTELHHENVVALLDCKETSNCVCLVMEYCNGGDLADYLHAKGTLSEDTIRLFLRQLAGAMKALKAKGIVHRDLKPQNILLCHGGKQNLQPSEIRLKIADFGFARFLKDGVMAATLCGSPMYMAPEVIMSLQYDAKADLWSIGTIVFQCLTGTAPFQAATPTALKIFYEMNTKLSPNIPSCTSAELTDLLQRLLRRNAKDRMDFDEFFNHPFHKKVIRTTSPVPVPSRQRSFSREPSPTRTTISPSLNNIVHPPADKHNIPEEPCQEATRSAHSSPESTYMSLTKDRGSPLEEPEGFVLVSSNLPTDMNYVDGHSPNLNKRHSVEYCGTSPPRAGFGFGYYPNQSTSPLSSPRPSCLPVTNSPNTKPSAPPSEPIPVPTQKEAYQQIQQSLQESPHQPRSRTQSPSNDEIARSPPIAIQRPPTSDPMFKTSTDVSSLSPPSVQFTIGTPPMSGRRRNSSGGGGSIGTPPLPSVWGASPPYQTRPQSTNSPIRRSSLTSAASYLSNQNFILGANTCLTPFLNSLSKLADCNNKGGMNVDAANNSNFAHPLLVQFGNRAQTLPEISNQDCVNNAAARTQPHVEPITFGESLFPKSGSMGRLTDPFNIGLKAAFGPNQGSPTSSNTLLLPYGRSSYMFPCDIPTSNMSGAGFCPGTSPTGLGALAFGTSPPNMESSIMFYAPELPEETLMEKDHNETLAKLNFVLALVDCILELARTKSSPISALTDSMFRREVNSDDQLPIVSESHRRAEQLVLYVRALQMLSSSLNLSRDGLKSGKLQPSTSVKNVVSAMNERYRHCLRMCKSLNTHGILSSISTDPTTSNITADRLIYSYAIEMCQSAALDELFGNPQECFRRYQTAQILLHSLAQQVNSEEDRGLLNKYKEAVEKRLYVLQQQGYIYAYDTT